MPGTTRTEWRELAGDCALEGASGRGSESWIDWFAFEGEDGEDALVGAEEVFPGDEPVERFDAQ